MVRDLLAEVDCRTNTMRENTPESGDRRFIFTSLGTFVSPLFKIRRSPS
jgi:hypothetical protein